MEDLEAVQDRPITKDDLASSIDMSNTKLLYVYLRFIIIHVIITHAYLQSPKDFLFKDYMLAMIPWLADSYQQLSPLRHVSFFL